MDAVLQATQHDLFWLPDTVERLDRHDVLALRDGSDAPLLNAVLRTATDDVEALVAEMGSWHTCLYTLAIALQTRYSMQRRCTLRPSAGPARARGRVGAIGCRLLAEAAGAPTANP
jgi:hypothetical protein